MPAHSIESALAERILVLDGAMGTMIQARGLEEVDFRAERFAHHARWPGQARVVNSGAGGMWSTWGVDNLDARVIEKKPDTLFIEFGINDAYLDYKTTVISARDNLENMIQRVQATKPDTEIVLMTMNPPVGNHLKLRPDINKYYEMYRQVAKDRGLKLVDHALHWERILEHNRHVFHRFVPDGIHPGAEGHELMARQIIDFFAIKPPLKLSLIHI